MRIAASAEVRIVVGRAERGLIHVGLSERHCVGSAQSLDGNGIALRHLASQYADARARRETDHIEIVLHRKWNAGQRAERQALAPTAVQRRGGIARRCIGYRKESVQFGTVARDALE